MMKDVKDVRVKRDDESGSGDGGDQMVKAVVVVFSETSDLGS